MATFNRPEPGPALVHGNPARLLLGLMLCIGLAGCTKAPPATPEATATTVVVPDWHPGATWAYAPAAAGENTNAPTTYEILNQGEFAGMPAQLVLVTPPQASPYLLAMRTQDGAPLGRVEEHNLDCSATFCTLQGTDGGGAFGLTGLSRPDGIPYPLQVGRTWEGAGLARSGYLTWAARVAYEDKYGGLEGGLVAIWDVTLHNNTALAEAHWETKVSETRGLPLSVTNYTSTIPRALEPPNGFAPSGDTVLYTANFDVRHVGLTTKEVVGRLRPS